MKIIDNKLGICFCNDTIFNAAICCTLANFSSLFGKAIVSVPWGKSNNAVIKLQILAKYFKTLTFKSSLKSFLLGLKCPHCIMYNLDVDLSLPSSQAWSQKELLTYVL